MKLFEKKSLVIHALKDGSIKTEMVAESKLREWELNHLEQLLKANLLPPTNDKRTKVYKKWEMNNSYIRNRIKQLMVKL